MSNPLISIIIISYNLEEYIAKCINSVKAFKGKEIEIVIVDNFSEDNSLDIINKQIENNDRIRVIKNEQNNGPMAARIQGLNAARGEYLLFIDGDDYINSDSIKKLCEIAKYKKYDCILFNYMIEDEFNNKIRPWDSNFYKKNNKHIMIEYDYLNSLFNTNVNFSIWTKLIKKNFLEGLKNINYLSKLFYAEDLALSYLIAINKPVVYVLDESVYYYVQRKSSLMHNIDYRILDITKSINFIKYELEAEKLLDKYKEEFEYLVYKHIYFYRKDDIYANNSFGKKIFSKWKNYNIKIYNNKYYKKLYNNENIKQRFLNKIILKSYFLGVLYYKLKDRR